MSPWRGSFPCAADGRAPAPRSPARPLLCLWRGVCPARAWRATFVLTIPALTPDLLSPRRAPQVDQEWAANLPHKAGCVSRNS